MTEVPEIGLPEAKDTLKISKTRFQQWEYNNERLCLSVSLPLCFTGATPPRPDPSHPPSAVAAIVKRFGYKPPPLERRLKRKFRRFIQLWMRRNLVPLTDEEIPTFELWLASTPYTSSRKEELAKLWKLYCADPSRYNFKKVKSFIKDETYPEYKYPRLINSRIDAAKCYFGPIVQAVSDHLFSLPWFIKKIPVPDRPVAIRDLLYSVGTDVDYVFTDYTAFEAHFTKEIMDITQVELFKYMLKDCHQQEWLDVYSQTMAGRNHLTFKYFDAQLDATRMSGEMDTSLSNGFSNLMLFLFACHERGATDVVGFVEGDDGLFRVTPSTSAPTAKDFSDLGFTIKIEHTENLSEASFCGQVYDMSDLIVVTDPKEVVLRLGWTNKKYTAASLATRMQLLRAKAYSLVYQYHGCPILDVLGRRLLHLTEGTNIEPRILDSLDQWERQKLVAAMTSKLPTPIEPGQNTRNLVSKLYDVSISEQLAMEKKFSTIELGLHDNPFNTVDPSWIDYFERYSLDHRVRDPCWQVRSERKLISRLSQYKCCQTFVASL